VGVQVALAAQREVVLREEERAGRGEGEGGSGRQRERQGQGGTEVYSIQR